MCEILMKQSVDIKKYFMVKKNCVKIAIKHFP